MYKMHPPHPLSSADADRDVQFIKSADADEDVQFIKTIDADANADVKKC